MTLRTRPPFDRREISRRRCRAASRCTAEFDRIETLFLPALSAQQSHFALFAIKPLENFVRDKVRN